MSVQLYCSTNNTFVATSGQAAHDQAQGRSTVAEADAHRALRAEISQGGGSDAPAVLRPDVGLLVCGTASELATPVRRDQMVAQSPDAPRAVRPFEVELVLVEIVDGL